MVLVRKQQSPKIHMKHVKNEENQEAIEVFDDIRHISIVLVGLETIYRHALEEILNKNLLNGKQETISLYGCMTVEEFNAKSGELPENLVKSLIVLLLDESREAFSTLSNIEDVKTINPSLKIIVISNSKNADYVSRCIDKGIHAYILSDVEPDLLIDCVITVAHDYMVFPTDIYQRKFNTELFQPASDSIMEKVVRMSGQNEMETKVLGCLAVGMPNKEISQALDLSDSATKFLVRTILKKIGAKNRAQAAVWAQQNGYSWNN